MVKLLISGLGLMTVLLVVGMFAFQNQSKIDALEKSRDRGKLSWYVEMAKAKGRQEIAVAPMVVEYSVPRTFDDAVANYNVIIAEPIDHKSYAGSRNILTWYKFKIIEELSKPTAVCTKCPSVGEVPTDMLPLQQGEFLTPQLGGEVVVDGVRVVNNNSQFPPFEIGKRYLLFLSLDEAKTVASLHMGPWGTFRSDSNGNLEAIDKTLPNPVKDQITNSFGDSLSSLRIHLKKRI
jgi:hypothetical protein